ncbi:MAG: NDP-sugar synthase [Candidatus Sericytochromatia bacterium]|nr:NDP-sugar synthase [Candidatus Tanganyikabacteria bacterium]
MIGLIIAGGEGTRLRPLTYHTPKPLVPLCGRPIIDYQIDLCRRHGLTDIVVNLHYLADDLERHLGDGRALGVRIRYSREQTPLGTAGAVKLAAPFFDGEPMVVFNGDVLTDLDLSALLVAHRASGARATLTVTPVADPTPFGLVLHGADGRIAGFLEKPSLEEARSRAQSFWINAGTYVLHPDLFDTVPADTPWSFERQVFPALLEADVPFFAFRSAAYWLDCGSPAAYIKAHRDLLSGAMARPASWRAWPAGAAEPLAFVEGDVALPEDLRIDSGPVWIGEGASLGSGVRLGEFAVVGPEAVLDDGARVQGAIVGRGAYIGPNAQILGGIIGAHSRIEADVRMNGGTLLADHSVIGRGTCLA